MGKKLIVKDADFSLNSVVLNPTLFELYSTNFDGNIDVVKTEYNIMDESIMRYTLLLKIDNFTGTTGHVFSCYSNTEESKIGALKIQSRGFSFTTESGNTQSGFYRKFDTSETQIKIAFSRIGYEARFCIATNNAVDESVTVVNDVFDKVISPRRNLTIGGIDANTEKSVFNLIEAKLLDYSFDDKLLLSYINS